MNLFSRQEEPSYPGATEPPPGVIADPEAPNPKATEWLVVTSVVLVIPSITVMLRCYTRLALMKKFTYSDIFLLIGYLCFVGNQVVGYLTLYKGDVGKHSWNIYPERYSAFNELVNLLQVMYMPTMLFTKLSILWQIKEVFVTRRYNIRWWIVIGLMAIDVSFFTSALFATIFACIPRETIWNPAVPGRCINMADQLIAAAAITIFHDFSILIFPLYWLWKLQIQKSRKWILTAIFSPGLFACFTSIMQIASSSFTDPDFSSSLYPVALWASGEAGTAIVVACLPALPILFNKQRRVQQAPTEQRYGSIGTYKTPISRRRLDQWHDDFDSGKTEEDGNSLERFYPDHHGQVTVDIESGRYNHSQRPRGIMRTTTVEQVQVVVRP